MNSMKSTRTIWGLSALLTAAVSAGAATPYTLTCTPKVGGAFTIPLTGFNFTVTNLGAGQGSPSGRFTPPEFTIQFVPSAVYGELYRLAATSSEITQCVVVYGEGQGVTGRDRWTQTTAPRGSVPQANNASTATGAIQWKFEELLVAQVTVTESENSAGAPVSAITAKFNARSVSVTPQ